MKITGDGLGLSAEWGAVISDVEGRLRELEERFKAEKAGKLLRAALAELSDGYAVVSVPAVSGICVMADDGREIVQGGFIDVVADFAAVYAAMASIPQGHTPLAHNNTHYLRRIYAGERVVAIAQKEEVDTSSRIWIRVKVYNGKNKVAAIGTYQFAKPRA